MTPEAFIAHWANAGSAERSNAQPFLIDLCDLLGVDRPPPASGGDGGPYRFERNVSHYDADERVTTRRMDLYKRECFVLEAKQGTNAAPQPELFALAPEATRRQAVRNSPGWAQHMLRAKGQAEDYVRDLPASEAHRHSWSSATSGSVSTSTPTSPAPGGTTRSSRIAQGFAST